MDEKKMLETLASKGHGACLAFAIRCARRAFPLTEVLSATDRENVSYAISFAEEMMKGVIGREAARIFASDALAREAEGSGKIALANAIHAATSTGFLADALVGLEPGQAAHWAAMVYMFASRAMVASDLAPAAIDAAVQRDVDILSGIELGPKQPVDPSDGGPLGPIWPKVPPEWRGALAYLLHVQAYTHEPLHVIVEPGASSPELVKEFFASLDSLYRSCGGSGLKITKEGAHGTRGGETVR
jgi:hypothetical protein